VDTVKKLSDSNIEPVINLIGYQATKEGIDQLKEMAEASEGNFINATNQDQLNDEFEKARNMSEIWADWNADKQEEFKDIKEVVAGQIDDWEEKMSERQKRQEDNLQEALDYILDEREFDLGPVPGNAYKQNRIQ